MRKWLQASFAMGLATALFAWVVYMTPIALRFDNRYGLGILYYLRGPVQPPGNAVIVAVDRATITWLRELSDYPSADDGQLLSCLPESARGALVNTRGAGSLPRSVYGCLISQLKEAGSRVVIFDVLFSFKGDENDDRMFAEAIRRHGTVGLLAGLERSTAEEHQVQPLALFADNAAATGAFVVSRTTGPVYGYWRNFPLFEGMRSLPDVANELYRSSYPGQPPDETSAADFEYFWLYGPPGSIATVSVRDLLSGYAAADFRGATQASAVFVGASDPSMTNFPDTFPSFLAGGNGANLSGVELAATAFLNLNLNQRLRRLPPLPESTLVVLFAFAAGFLVRARTRYVMLIAPAAAVLYLAVASLVFSHGQIFLPIITPVFVVVPAALVLAGEARYRLAWSLLARLTPARRVPGMLTRVTDDRAEPVDVEATVAFFDLAGSTGIGETLPPVDFSRLMNDFHDTVTDAVERHRGEIVTFEGDGLMAAFIRSDGAGVDHALHACKSAIDAIRDVREINRSNQQKGLPQLRVRIGINSGDVAAADVGARHRYNFSVVGDVVNLASRFEQLGKTLFPEDAEIILVGQTTQQLADGHGLRFVDCGEQLIRSRQRPERLYRMIVE